MKDDEMDDLLIRGALDYNEPSAAPREGMWARIAAARREAAERSVASAPAKIGSSIWIRFAVAAAALLAVGIGIGRRLERDVARISPGARFRPRRGGPHHRSRQSCPQA